MRPHSPTYVNRIVGYSLQAFGWILDRTSGVRHDIAKGFGDRVRKLRLRKRLSQETLAERAELDRTHLSGIERGVENPTLFTIQQLADALEVSVGDLMEGL
jgi:DNA-binding XRE family transcriptional regulator